MPRTLCGTRPASPTLTRHNSRVAAVSRCPALFGPTRAHALNDMNPVYLDPEFAAKSRFGGIVSPPVMLQTWTMPSPKLEGIGERGGAPVEIDGNPTAFLDDAGYSSTVATNSEFDIERYPRLGDVINATSVFESVSEEKKTALGTGFFLTWVITYTDQNDEVLGRQRFRVLRFRPAH